MIFGYLSLLFDKDMNDAFFEIYHEYCNDCFDDVLNYYGNDEEKFLLRQRMIKFLNYIDDNKVKNLQV